MGKDFNRTLIKIAVIIGLAALLWFGFKWFGNYANDNAGTMDGGASNYEQQVENQ